MSVLPPTSTVLNVTSRHHRNIFLLIILTHISVPLRLFIDSVNAWPLWLVGQAITSY